MFWLQTAIFTIVVLCLSWWAGKMQTPSCGANPPICFILFGLVLLISSFFIGRWEGMALSISSVSIVLSSMICLTIVTAIQFFKKDDPS